MPALVASEDACLSCIRKRIMSGNNQHNAEGAAVCVPAASVIVVLHLHGYGNITAGAASAW